MGVTRLHEIIDPTILAATSTPFLKGLNLSAISSKFASFVISKSHLPIGDTSELF